MDRLREALLPVFGLDAIDEIQPEHSFVDDIGADSLDFVEIIYIIEQVFGVVLKMNEVFVGGKAIDPDQLFDEGKLTEKSAVLLRNEFPENKEIINEGMTKAEFLQLLKVQDLANIIQIKLEGAESNA